MTKPPHVFTNQNEKLWKKKEERHKGRRNDRHNKSRVNPLSSHKD